jgi:hypothetical protein
MGENLQFGKYFLDNESKASLYLVGAAFRCVTYYKDYCIFRSRHKELVENFNRFVGCEYAVHSDPRGLNSHFLRIYDKNLSGFLKERWGLDEDLSKRLLPNFDYENYIDHFARGFHDAEAYVKKRTENDSSIIEMQFNPVFLSKLNELMKKYAGIEREYSGNKKLIYGLNDANKFYNFIYKDQQFIENSGLYLPSKLWAFNVRYEPKNKACFNRQIRGMPDSQGCSAG